jgi:NAD(P)H-dependent FMN reductase
MEKLFIPILLGTNRKGRQSEHVAKLVLSELQKHEDIETQLLDIIDYKLPHDDYGPALKEQFPEYRDAIMRADGLIIISPEYNHSYPGTLKSIMDLLYEEYSGMPAGIVAVSKGPFDGLRMIEHLISLLHTFGMPISPKDLLFPNVREVFSEEGVLKDEKYLERTSEFIYEMIRFTKLQRS